MTKTLFWIILGTLLLIPASASTNPQQTDLLRETPPIFAERLQVCKEIDVTSTPNQKLTEITVLSSGSMANVFDHTDLILGYKPTLESEVGLCDIIIYQTTTMNQSIIHRVNHIFENSSYLMSGDTNNRYDSERPMFEDVIHRVVEVRRQ